MNYKLWISPEGLEFLKDWHVGKIMKCQSITAWDCYNGKKKSDKFNISFSRKENEDAGFTINCSREDAACLAHNIFSALEEIK